MALKADTSSNESLVCNGDFTSFIENGQILVLKEPLMICTQGNIENGRAIVLDSISDESGQNLNLPEIIFDRNYFQLDTDGFQNSYDNFQYINERQQVDDGLAVLEILCSNNSSNTPDQPEFIDIGKLTGIDKTENTKDNDVLLISDDDDVVFVREYKENSDEQVKDDVKEAVESNVKLKNTENGVRRNPIRKVRMKSKDLSKEHIFEEDFALLDSIEEEAEAEEKENKVPAKKSTAPNENFKQWPVNVHERPKYNAATKKIEAFDYTVKEVPTKRPPNKKPRLETVAVRRKPKKKYYTRKRKPRVVKVCKVPVKDLKPVVDSTTELLKDFFTNMKESKNLVDPNLRNPKFLNFQNSLKVFKNQAMLFSIVNDMDQKEVVKKLDVMGVLKGDAKN